MADRATSQGPQDANRTIVRLIDAGRTASVRAQAIYHGIADVMAFDDAPVLVLADPDAPFISAGMHQDVAREIDLQACVNSGTPVIRREIGGPALALSDNDMLVHFVLPRHRPEAAVGAGGLYARFAEPLVRTWQTFGVSVAHAAWGGISLGRYRLTGLQAGTVGHVVVVGGSLLHDFDADIIAQRAGLPSDEVRVQIRDMVREHLARANRAPDRETVKGALLAHVADALGWTLQDSALRDDELEAIARREAQVAQVSHVFSGGRRLAKAELRTGRGLALVDHVHRSSAGLVRLRMLERAGVIEDIEITGELTSLPTDGLERLAPRLVGLRRDAPDLASRIHVQMGLLGLELPGVTAVDLATALRPVVPRSGPDPLDLLFGDPNA